MAAVGAYAGVYRRPRPQRDHADASTDVCRRRQFQLLPLLGNPVSLAAAEEGDKEVNLLLSPNPAQGRVDVHYDFASSLDGDSRTIEIYSLMGVLMDSQELKDVKGSWSAGLGRFPAGQYIVIMKLNGSVLTQQALIVE